MTKHKRSELRLYGVPESLRPRDESVERFELFVDTEVDAAGFDRLRALQRAVDEVFADPEAAAAFRDDPRTYLNEAGLPEAAAAWDSLEVKLGQAFGDERLKELAEAGDVEGFVDRLQENGLIPPSLDVAITQAEAMGFTPVFPVVAVLVVAVWTWVGVVSSVVAAVMVAAAAGLWTWLAAWTSGPGGDNPDESHDVATPAGRFPSLQSPHVMRLLNQFLHADLLQKLASHLHDQGFGGEVTAELIKRAILAAWKKATTGEVSPPEQDRVYMEIIQALGNQQLVEQVPELTSVARYAMLASGFPNTAFELMVRMREPVRLISIDFSPRELLTYQKVLIIPTGGLYGLDTSGSFKDRLEEYIRLGGICVCMAQQHGYDFAALPGGIGGYGWAEDQSCHAQSVVITASHPIFAGQDTDVMDVSIDGFFTAWPGDSQLLLRRRVNGQPALLTYRYGAGRVVVTTAYADWGVGHNQLTNDERLLMRDIFAWARLTGLAVPEYDPDELPLRITCSVSNRSDQDADRILLNTVSPDKELREGRYTLNVAVPAGESREVVLETIDLTTLGYWSLDAVLQDDRGQTVDINYDAATFLVNNFDDTVDGVGYKAEPITFSAVVDEEHLLAGATSRVRLLIWNYSEQLRTLTVQTDVNHSNPETRTVRAAAGRRTELVYEFGPLTPRAYRFWAYLFDETGRSLGSTTKGFFAHLPAAEVTVGSDRRAYRPGETVQVLLEYRSRVQATFAADVLVAVTNPDGGTVFDERFTEVMRPEIPSERSFRFTLPMTVRYGAFKVRTEVDFGGNRIGYHEVYFTSVLQGTLGGYVLDSVTHAPIPGARVSLDGGPPVSPAETGTFSFPAQAGGHWVTAEAPGYDRSRAYTVVAPERIARVENVYLSPQKGRVEGFVMDLVSDQAIPAARVTPEGFPPQTTSVNGSFALELPRGERWINAEASGYAGRRANLIQVLPGRTSRIASFFLVPTHGWVEGVVRRADTGDPLAGAEVYVPGAPPTPVDADGRFSLAFPSGGLTLRARAPGHAEATLVAYVPSGRAVRLDDFFLVPAFGEVTGVVRDTASQAPLAGARVIAGNVNLAITGPDGYFRFRLLAQNQTLEAQAPGYHGNAITVRVVEGKSLEGFDLGLRPRQGRLEGVVLSAANGQPLAGARLRGPYGGDAVTGSDGTFSFSANAQPTPLTVEAPSYVPVSLTADVYPGRGTRLDAIYLAHSLGEVTGRVVDAAGVPVPKARVWADYGGDVRSDADGRFRVAAPAGVAWLHAEAEDFQPLQRFQLEVQPGQTAQAGDLPLAQAYGAITGTVRAPDGSGLAGIRVWADVPAKDAHPDTVSLAGTVVDRSSGRPIEGARVSGGGDLSLTGADGTYRLSIRPGWHSIEAAALGYRNLTQYMRVDWGFASATRRLELSPDRGRVTGRVACATTGRSLTNARVWADGAEWVLTDAAGRYTLELTEGERTLRAVVGNHGEHRGIRIDVEPGRTSQAPDLLLAPLTGWVEGVVRNAMTGAPLPGAAVWPEGGDGVSTDPQGRFRLSAQPGWRRLTAVAQGYRDQAQTSVQVQPGATTTVDALQLFPLLAEVVGTVRNALDGAPLAGMRVWAGNNFDGAVVTGEDGRYLLRVSPGVQYLQAEGSGYQGRAGAEVFASAGRATEAGLLALLPVGAQPPRTGTGAVEGQLVDAVTQNPLAGALIWYDDADLALGVLRQEQGTRITSALEPYAGTHAVAGDPTWRDYTLRLEAKAVSNQGWGFFLRYRDERNHYRFLCINDPASGGPLRRLERVVAGERTVLAEDRVPYAVRSWVPAEASVTGEEIVIRLGGREIIRVRDGAHAAGGIGLVCWAQPGQLFRSIRVEDQAGPLFVETCTEGLAAWTVVDAPGTTPPSRWTALAPTGTRTGPDGNFRLEGLTPGQHSLYLAGESGYVTYRSDFRLCYFNTYPGRTVDLVLHPFPQGGVVSGVLRNAITARPASGVRVWVAGRPESAVTGPDGAFSFALAAVDQGINPRRYEIWVASEAYAGAPVRILEGQAPPGATTSVEAALLPTRGEVAVSLAAASSGEPLEGVEVYHGDPALRWGGFTLSRDEGSREGDDYLDGPALVAGDTAWTDSEVRFEVRCSQASGWGALLRHQDRHTNYRLFYLAQSGSGDALIRLVRCERGHVTVLGEARRAHDPNRWYAVRFAVAGQALTVELNGERLLTAQDDILASGRAGIIGWGQYTTTLRKVAVTGTDGTTVDAADPAAWTEDPGYGPNGGNAGQVQGPFTGVGAADVTHVRYGTFDYHFPVPDGQYRVELTMAESYWQQAGRRRFHVALNRRVVEQDLDLFATAGFKTAVRRTYTASAERGWLHVLFRATTDNALVNFIRVWAGAEPAAGEAPLYVVRCGSPSERPLYQAATDAGLAQGGWSVVGGEVAVPAGTPADVATALRTYREGNCAYRLRLAPGPHTVELFFVEHALQWPGQRVMEVLVDGMPTIRNLDVTSLVGKARPHRETVTVESTGEPIELSFRGVYGAPVVSAIRVAESSLLIDCGAPTEMLWADTRRSSFRHLPPARALTGADGTVRFTRLAAGDYLLRAEKTDWSTAPGEELLLSLPATGGRTLELRGFLRRRNSSVTGRVLDGASGQALEGVEVWYDQRQGVASTGPDGAFRLDLPPGSHAVHAAASGYKGLSGTSHQAQVFAEAGAAFTTDLILVPEAFTPTRPYNAASGPISTGPDGSWNMVLPVGRRTLYIEGTAVGGRRDATLDLYPARTLRLDLTPGTAGQGAVLEGSVYMAASGGPGRLDINRGDPHLAYGALRQLNDTYVATSDRYPYLGTCAVAGETSWSDYRLSLQSRCGDDDAWGVVFRYSDDRNYYRFFWLLDQANGGPLRRLERVQGGTFTTLVEDRAPYPTNQWLDLRIEALGDRLSIFVDGRQVLSARDGNHAAGKVGLYCWQQPDQLFRGIRVERPDGTPLMVESFTGGMTAWTVVDAEGATPPSRWEVVSPTGVQTSSDGTFRLPSVPEGRQTIYALGAVSTGSYDNSLAYLTFRNGDRWRVNAHVAETTGAMRLRLVNAITGRSITGARVWAASDPRQVALSGSDGRIDLQLPAGRAMDTPPEQALYVVADGYATRPANQPQVHLPLPSAAGDDPVLRLVPTGASLRGTVRGAVSGQPLSGVDAFWGEYDHATSSARVVGGRWSGDPLLGVFHGPALLSSGTGWSETVISADVKAIRPGGVALVLRYRDSGSFYRAVLLHDPDRNETAVENGVLDGQTFGFTRRGPGWTQIYTGTLQEDGTLSGTFASGGRTYRFYGRRRTAAAPDPISGEWVLNANGWWLRAQFAITPGSGFTGRCFDVSFGGSAVQIERWSGGRRTMLAEVLGRGHLLNEWAGLRFQASGNSLRLQLGGVTVLEATDPAPLPAGRAGIQAFSGADTLFRQVQMSTPAGRLLFRGDFDPNLSRWSTMPGWGVVGGWSYRVEEPIAGDERALVTHGRYAGEIQYALGLTPGNYKVELAFCESYWTANGARIFDVFMNDLLVDPALDIHAVVGGHRLLLRRYQATVGVAGLLIRLTARKDNALINHVRIWGSSANPDTEPPLIAVRPGSGEGDPELFLCSNGWGYQGGNPYAAAAGTTVPNVDAEEQNLLLNQRLGNFRYRIRLSPGRYEPELSFVELQNPRRAGHRVFDVYVNGRLLVTKLDVAQSVGNGLLRLRPSIVEVGAEGVLDLEFVSRTGYAMVNLIRVYPEGQTTPVYVADAGGTADREWSPGAPLEAVWAGRSPQGTRTGRYGRFRISGVPPGEQRVSLRGEGLATQRAGAETLNLPVRAGREHGMELFVAPVLAILSGEVVDIVTGAPVEGAEVWYQGATSRARTDELGRFRIPDFPVDRRDIYARASGYRAPGANEYVMTAQITGGQEGQYRVFLTPAYARMAGHLRDAVTGAAVEGARIWLGTQRRGVVTGPEGRFVVTDFPAGQAVPLYAGREGYRAPGNEGHVITLQSVAGRTTTFEAFLQPTHGVLQGTVLDLVTQEPVAGALVSVDSGDISTNTNPLGGFSLRVPGGEHRLYVEAAGYISDAGHNPSAHVSVTPGKTVEFVLHLKSISGTVEGRVLDSITLDPVSGALVYVDEGFANTLTDAEGRYHLPQSNREHSVFVKAVDYASDREDGWMATATVQPDRSVAFNHMLRPTLQLVSFAFSALPEDFELRAGQAHTVTCSVRNTGKREGGATVRLIIPGFLEQENTEWIAPGAEGTFLFSFQMPTDALSGEHQEVIFELEGGARHRLLVPIRGVEVAVEATLDKTLYALGEVATLRLRIANLSGGSFPVYTRAQFGEATQASSRRILQQRLEVEHAVPVTAHQGKLFFGVYLETGRALYLNAFYVPRQGELVTVATDRQVYDLDETVRAEISLTESGRIYFEGAHPVSGQFRLLRADDGAEILPARQETVPADSVLLLSLNPPAHLRQGTYLVECNLTARDKSAQTVHAVDVRGYKARFLEFLTDRREYLRIDTIVVHGALEISHALRCRLEVHLLDGEGQELGSVLEMLDLPVGRSPFRFELPLDTRWAGHHTLSYALYAVPEEIEPVLLAGGMQGVEVEGPVILALNTDRRRYRPGDPVFVTVTARGRATVPLRLSWSTGDMALERIVVMDGLSTSTYELAAPVGEALYLKAEFLGDTVSTLTTPALVRP